MFNWEGCPPKLFDAYIEVGEVKASIVESAECVFVEVWIATVWSNDYLRPECKYPVRRPVYGVLKQIRELCGDKSACVIIMCDDLYDDTINWGVSLSLLLQELKEEKRLKHSLLYTKRTAEQVKEIEQTTKWRKEKDKKEFLLLFELLDAVLFEQANCYSKSKNTRIYATSPDIPLLLSEYIRLTNNDI